MHGDASHDAWNGSGTDLGALATAADAHAAAAADARCRYTLRRQF